MFIVHASICQAVQNLSFNIYKGIFYISFWKVGIHPIIFRPNHSNTQKSCW